MKFINLSKRFYLIQIGIACLLGLAYQPTLSQTSDSARNTFYAGFANEGAIYSINYDRIFGKQTKHLWSYRIGFSVIEDAIALPIGIYLLTGKSNSHAEIGLGIIPYLDKYQSFLSDNDLSDKQMYLVPSIGYRFQKPKGGFFFRAFFSPSVFLDPPSGDFWKMDPGLKFMAGIGLGYSF